MAETLSIPAWSERNLNRYLILHARSLTAYCCTATSADRKPYQTYTILTTHANDKMAYLHDRQPVILDDIGATEWLDTALEEFAPLVHLLAPLGDEAID